MLSALGVRGPDALRVVGSRLRQWARPSGSAVMNCRESPGTDSEVQVAMGPPSLIAGPGEPDRAGLQLRCPTRLARARARLPGALQQQLLPDHRLLDLPEPAVEVHLLWGGGGGAAARGHARAPARGGGGRCGPGALSPTYLLSAFSFACLQLSAC